MSLSLGSLSLTHKTGLLADLAAQIASSTVITGGMYHATDTGALKYGLTPTTYFEFAKKGETPNFVATTTESLFLTYVNGELTGDVHVSTEPRNKIQSSGDGLFVEDLVAVSTSTIDLDYDGSLQASVKISSNNTNQLTQKIGNQEGLFVKKLTIDPASAAYLSLDANNALKLNKLATMDVYVDTVSTDLANAITINGLLTTNTVGMGDFVYIQNATLKTQKGFICKVNAPTTAADFIPVEFPDYTVAEIRAMLSAGAGIRYTAASGLIETKLSDDGQNALAFDATGGLFLNPRSSFSGGPGVAYNLITGMIGAKVSTNASNDITIASDGGLYSDARLSAVNVTKGANVVEQTLQATLDELYAATASANVTATNGLTISTVGETKVVKLGGDLLEYTVINGGLGSGLRFQNFNDDDPLDINNSSVTVTNSLFFINEESQFISEVDLKVFGSTKGLVLTAPNNTRYKFTVNNAGQLVGTIQV